jgi:hypothetical protein
MLSTIETRRHLNQSHGAHRGWAGSTPDVRPGELFGCPGPKGARKSTTTRLMVDCRRPTSGSIGVLDHDPRRAGVGAHGETHFMSSRVMDEVDAVADRIDILRDGLLVTVDGGRRPPGQRCAGHRDGPRRPGPARGVPRPHGVAHAWLADAGTTLQADLIGARDAVVKASARHTVMSLGTTDTWAKE